MPEHLVAFPFTAITPFEQRKTHDQDDASSVYSRSTTATGGDNGCPSRWRRSNQSEIFDYPEVKPIDHQIAMFGGTSVALETTGAHLRATKAFGYRPLEDRLKTLEDELTFLQEENKFFHTCSELLRPLWDEAEKVCQTLKLQYCFEPEIQPAGNERLLKAVRTLQDALAALTAREVQAEEEWKEFWNVPQESHASEWI